MSKANLQSLGRHHDDEDLFGEYEMASEMMDVEQTVEWTEEEVALNGVERMICLPDAAGRWLGSAICNNIGSEKIGDVKLRVDGKEETMFELRLAKSTLVVTKYFSTEKLYKESVLGRQQEQEFSYLPTISKIFSKLGRSVEVVAVESISFANMNVAVPVGSLRTIATISGSDMLSFPGLMQMPEGNPISGFSSDLLSLCEATKIKAKVVTVVRESKANDYMTFKAVEKLFPHVSEYLGMNLELPPSSEYTMAKGDGTDVISSSLLYT